MFKYRRRVLRRTLNEKGEKNGELRNAKIAKKGIWKEQFLGSREKKGDNRGWRK
jgi:hypothetical protein